MEIIDRLRLAIKVPDQALGPKLPHAQPLIKSAVMIPFFQLPKSKNLELLLTVRQKTLSSHGGQVCLPGGRYERGLDKDFSDTALREC